MLFFSSGVKLDFKDEQQDEEMRQAKDKFENDRRHEVDAAIIRIMKGRQQLDHSELVAELNAQLRHRFIPTMDMVKKCIEGLISKDYISRSDENRYKITPFSSLSYIVIRELIVHSIDHWMIRRSVLRLIDWLNDWSIIRLIDWLID